MRGVADLPAGNAQPDVLGGDVLHLVRLVEDHEVVAEQDAALDFLLQSSQQHEEKGVVQYDHIGGEDAIARPLEEADAVVFGEVGGITAQLGGAEPALGAHLVPYLGVRFYVIVRQAAVGGSLRPLVNPLQLLSLGGRE